MSNLGGYQILTTVAKRVGGPGYLVALIGGAGAVIGGIMVKGYDVVTDKYKVWKNNRHNIAKKVYTIENDAESNEGLAFKRGDTFRVLESDADSILIELVGNSNNPYFVSANLLENISDFRLADI